MAPAPPHIRLHGPPSALRVRLSFYAVATLFAVPYGALNSLNQNTQAVFGGEPGAAPEAVARSDDVARLANVALSAAWLVALFFVPAGISALRGARNAFAAMMFAWAVGGAALVGAFVLGGSPGGGPGLYACGLVFGLLVGLFGGLGYTAAEVYLDTCAEWMPLSLEAAGGDAPMRSAASTDARASAKGVDGACPATEGDALVAELAAETALRHKATASRYKNLFASQMYAFAEVGTVAFTLPGALGVTGGRSMLYFLAAMTVCLFAGAVASLFVPNLHEPLTAAAPPVHDASGPAASAQALPKPAPCAGLRVVGAAALQSAVRSVTCLSAYRWLAALAVVPYFLSAAWADNYFQFVVTGTQCALRDAPVGVGLAGVNIVALFGAGVQAVSAFVGPSLVGPRRTQFQEHVWVLALGNAAGAGGALLVVALGGLTPRLCGSIGALLATKALSSIAYGINNSVGVAAVLVWYDGPYQYLVVSALASRSVWDQLGGIVGPFTFSDTFALKAGGADAAGLAAAVYLAGSVAVVAAHLSNEGLERRRARRAAAGPAAHDAEVAGSAHARSAAEVELALTRGRMTAGFRKLE